MLIVELYSTQGTVPQCYNLCVLWKHLANIVHQKQKIRLTCQE